MDALLAPSASFNLSVLPTKHSSSPFQKPFLHLPSKHPKSSSSSICRSRSHFKIFSSSSSSSSSAISTTPAAAADPTAPDLEFHEESEKFDWFSNWYPIAPVCDLDKRVPHAKKVMGLDVVVWWDRAEEKWQVFDDRCPHRLAPLSEGRIDHVSTMAGVLMAPATANSSLRRHLKAHRFLADRHLGLAVLRRSSLLMALPSAGSVDSGDVSKPTDISSFKIPLRFPVYINGELGFVFTETGMTKAAEEYKDILLWSVGLGRDQKIIDIKDSSSGTKDDKEMEANMEVPGMTSNIGGETVETNQFGQVPSILSNTEKPMDPLQDLVKRMENQKDINNEECEEVWCDKENEVASETMQLKGKEFSDMPKNLVDETENVLGKNRMQGDSTMRYFSDQEE
ncbi:hypothetical protein ACLOJK_028675 [Asimina triloba]